MLQGETIGSDKKFEAKRPIRQRLNYLLCRNVTPFKCTNIFHIQDKE